MIVVPEPAAERRRDRAESLVSDAISSLGLLGDTHDVVVVTTAVLPDVDGAADLVTTAELPPEPAAGAWLLTIDPSVCSGERPAGVRTILVGPRRPPDRRPTARCDVEARDLSAAVMEILVRDTLD